MAKPRRTDLRETSIEDLMGSSSLAGTAALFQSTPLDIAEAARRLSERTKSTPVDLTPDKLPPDSLPEVNLSPDSLDPAARKTTTFFLQKEIPSLNLSPDRLTGDRLPTDSLAGDKVSPGPHRLRRIVLAQDVLAKGEEAVYDALWGQKTGPVEKSRLRKMGMTEISYLSRISSKNIRTILHRLVEKGFVEVAKEPDFAKQVPTEYRIFSYAAVLERYREKGILDYWKITNSVHLVLPPGVNLSPDGLTVPPDKLSPGPGNLSPDKLSNLSPDKLSPLPIGIVLGNQQQQPELQMLTTTLHEVLGWSEDATVLQIIEECRKRAPDATVEEIDYFLRQKAILLRQQPPGRILNAGAYLRAIVPPAFEGASFLEHRRREFATMEGENRHKAHWKAVLEDPNSTEAEIELAKSQL